MAPRNRRPKPCIALLEVMHIEIERYAPDFDSAESDEPFRPLEQLMAVLPKESHKALPSACHDLMLKKDSPIADFYPDEVEIDPNGKAMPWLWVALLPFIDEERLLLHFGQVREGLDEEALDRNRFRTATIFVHQEHGPLADALAQAQEAAKRSAGESQAVLDCASTGVGGAVLNPSKIADPHGFLCHVRAVGDVLSAPPLPRGRYSDIVDNRALALGFADPPKQVHKSELLAGALLPPPKLSPYDMSIRAPRLNRGMNIADLGGGCSLGPGGGGGGKGFDGGKGFGGKGFGGKGFDGGKGFGGKGFGSGKGFGDFRFQGAGKGDLHSQHAPYHHPAAMHPASMLRPHQQFGPPLHAQQPPQFAGQQHWAVGAAGPRPFPPAPPHPPPFPPRGGPQHDNNQAPKRPRHEQVDPQHTWEEGQQPNITPQHYQQQHFQMQHPQWQHPQQFAPNFAPGTVAQFGHPPAQSLAPQVQLDHLRMGLAQTLARRAPPNSTFQHQRP
jgi:hypothetical protein